MKISPEMLGNVSKASTMVAVYGNYPVRVPVYESIVIESKDGVVQRRRLKTGKFREKVVSGRFEFYGRGKDLYKAVALAQKYVPLKRFQVVSATEFFEDPEKYGKLGRWVEKDVES